MEKTKSIFLLVMIYINHHLQYSKLQTNVVRKFKRKNKKCGIIAGIRQSYLRLWRGNLLARTQYAALCTTSLRQGCNQGLPLKQHLKVAKIILSFYEPPANTPHLIPSQLCTIKQPSTSKGNAIVLTNTEVTLLTMYQEKKN